MKNIIITSIFILCIFGSCKLRQQKKTAGYYHYDTECLGVELDGSQTLRTWGIGRNRLDAVEQAKKNAVRDVLFKGILKGKNECNQKPVLFEVNAQEKHEDYFNKFFADKGPYAEFISMKDERIIPGILKEKTKIEDEVNEEVVVRVLRAELKKKMIDDKIISN